MSTPAAAVLNDATSGTGGGTVTPPGTGTGIGAPGAAAPGAAAANSAQFWSGWDKPEQKETRDWVANKNYADPFTLAKTAQGLEREAATLRAGKGYPAAKVNADGTVTPPDANAVKAWNAAVGVPETADKYDIPLPAANPYPEFKTYMAEAFLQAGVPGAMATQLAKGYEAAVGKMEASIRAAEDNSSKQQLQELEHTWGQNYQERVALAARGKEWLAKEVGGLDDNQLRSMESVIGTAKFMSAMWKIGAGNGEARFAGGDGGGGFKGGASEAQARFDHITSERAAGRISDGDWRSKFQPELDQLANTIAGGSAPAR